MLTVSYRSTGNWSGPVSNQSPVAVELSSEQSGLSIRHVENPVVDFNRTPLLPHQYSQNGPYLAVGDVNGDHLEDFFVGTDFGHSASVYVQQPQGGFRPMQLPGSENYEAMGAAFFDAEGDGDQDLYVVSGGSREEGLSTAYQDQLYINDGHGSFQSATNGLPLTRSSGGCVTVADFDGDGDPDIFRAGRIVPGQYPKPADSYLLRNEGRGRFTDVTDSLAPG